MNKRPSVKDWLSRYLLRHGPTRRSELTELAKREMICSPSTLDRAAAELGVPKGWTWRLPD